MKLTARVQRDPQNPDRPSVGVREGLERKIAAAEQRGERYTPTQDEWDRATRYQRKRMTWPDHIIAWIRRTP